ncbi:MAG: ATP-binding cassette domain-containing protein [Bacteroidetes bacterium]|nr:ATP-binding cassette domain-containing protein [Bacteroidota bacterium]
MEGKILRLSGVKIYQKDNLILNNINLAIAKGEFVYMIGKTGAGKSSLLKTLYGELLLREGSGNVAGFELDKLNSDSIPMLRRKLGIVFQDFQLLNDRSVLENLNFVMKATDWQSADLMAKKSEEVLRLVGLERKVNQMPYSLSGGEQQRVVIARALLNDPVLILADEPTGNLDPETSDEIIQLLHTISSRGTSVLMATHDYRIIEKFPGRIIKVDNQGLSELQ